MEGEGGVSEWVFGRKLVLLASKREGSAFVDQLNAHWAMLANQFTQEAGLVSDFDHRSYKRMGIDATPQPKLGAGIVAMERKGFFTRKGDALRGDIILPSRLYEATHAVVLAEQQARAQADVVREAGSQQVPNTEIFPGPADAPPAPSTANDGPPKARAVVTQDSASVDPPMSGSPWTTFPEGASGSLFARFRTAVPMPDTPEAQQVLVRVFRLVQVIERLLGALFKLADRFRTHEEDRDRRKLAKWEADLQLQEARSRRSTARQRLEQWEAAHPLRMWAAKAAGSEDGKPVEWRALHREAAVLDRRVQEIKGSLRSHREYLDAFDQEAQVLNGQEAEQKERLGRTLGSVQTLNPSLVDTLMSVIQEDERAWIEEARPAPSSKAQPEGYPPPQPRFTPATRARIAHRR